MYPRHVADNVAPSLRLHDFRETLLSIGFNPDVDGEIFMEYLGIWARRSWDLDVPILLPNRLVFICSMGIQVDVDTFLDTIF